MILRNGKKEGYKECYCTKCGETFTIDNIGLSNYINCPHCGETQRWKYIDRSASEVAYMKFISKALRRELEAIAAAKGIDISLAEKAVTKGCPVPPAARYSTLQDLDAGRHTEIDMFSGALINMGQQLGIPTPFNEYTYHMIKALEEKNDGLFDYTSQNQQITCAK